MVTHKDGKVDFVVLGGGIAGMRAAIELAPNGRVLVLTKDELYESSTEYAQGGIAAALGEDDEVSFHLHDTLQAGDGLCREEAVRILVEEGPQQIQQLIDWGMQFDRNGTKLAFTREGAHSRSRVLHAHGDSTGSEILRALMAKARTLHSIQLLPHAFATELLVDKGRVCGVSTLTPRVPPSRHLAAKRRAAGHRRAGAGLQGDYQSLDRLRRRRGHGLSRRRAVERHGVCAVSSHRLVRQERPTLSAFRGLARREGAHLRNILLERFMPHYHEAAELAPRDIVSRAIISEMQKTQREFVYLDLTEPGRRSTSRSASRESTPLACSYNIDITADLVPIRPAAHYCDGRSRHGPARRHFPARPVRSR